MSKFIEYNNITRIYRTRKSSIHALDSVTFDVSEGDFVSIVGPSGCGKSTLLKMTAGLLQPTSGQILMKGQVMTGPTASVGLVFQTPVLLPWRTVLSNVLLPIEVLGRDEELYTRAALSLLETAGLKGFEDKYPFELSGGMQQRVSLARALIHEPALLLMDEPFGSLDALTRDEMNTELLRIWEGQRKTVLFVTHSIPEAVFLSDYVITMTKRPGKVKLIEKIELVRPRKFDLRFTERYVNYVKLIQEAIVPH